MYARVYAFQTRDGQRVHVTEPERSRWRPDLGATVTVSYRSADPQGAWTGTASPRRRPTS